MIRTIVLRRIGIGIGMLWLVSVLVFAAMHVLPGDAARLLLGHDVPQGAVEAYRRDMGLDQSLWHQYWHWISGLLSGNWGSSLVSPNTSVASLVGTRLTNTLVLSLLTMVIVAPVSVGLGVFSATRNGSAADGVLSVLTLALSAVPGFVIGIVFVYVVSTNVLHLLPATSILDPSRSIWSQLRLVIGPAVVAALTLLPYPIRMVRAATTDVLQSDYIEMARLKGVPERQVVFRHALPNALAPIVQALGLTLLFLVGGVIVVEAVFSFPGIGLTLVDATNQRDIPVLQTIVVVLAALCVVINLLADLAVIALTPRLRARL